MLFFEGNQGQAWQVRSILASYASAIGQFLNPAKCSVLVGDSCHTSQQEEVRAVLEIDTSVLEENIWSSPLLMAELQRKSSKIFK